MLCWLLLLVCAGGAVAAEPWHQGSSRPQSAKHQLYHQQHVRHKRDADVDIPAGAAQQTAFYFDGSEKGLLQSDASALKASAPRRQFTVQLAVRLEGGQKDPLNILALTDVCEDVQPTWQLRLVSADGNGERQAAVEFWLATEMAAAPTRLRARHTYTPGRWTVLSASYDGHTLALYVDGARVALSNKQVNAVSLCQPRDTVQAGVLHSSIRGSCKRLQLAGVKPATKNAQGIRGYVKDIGLWNQTFSQLPVPASQSASAVFSEPGDTLDRWIVLGNRSPGLKAAPTERHSLTLNVGECAQSVCDHPAVVNTYGAHTPLTPMKTIRYKVVNLFDSDGQNPSVSASQIRTQHEHLNEAFSPYNITFDMSLIELRSTALRRKQIIFGCESHKIGDGECDRQCRYTITADDGGDCLSDEQVDALDCPQSVLGDGVCQPTCNIHQFGWDGGDCCNASHAHTYRTCVQPDSPLRSYIGVDEYKSVLNFSNADSLTIAFADWSNEELIGVSTFPWEKEATSKYGGVILQPDRFGMDGHRDSLVHEVGHALGLWHVHHGVTELSCNDLCYEHQASLLTGDLVADTQPTVKNLLCRDPDREESRVCGRSDAFEDTPFDNYMSYASEYCTSSFTPQQMARMHCYIDLAYRSWLLPTDQPRPAVVPVAPRVVHVQHSHDNTTHITLSWLAPFGQPVCRPDSQQPWHTDSTALCTPQGAVRQYGYRAWTTESKDAADARSGSAYWSPQQATGWTGKLRSKQFPLLHPPVYYVA